MNHLFAVLGAAFFILCAVLAFDEARACREEGRNAFATFGLASMIIFISVAIVLLRWFT